MHSSMEFKYPFFPFSVLTKTIEMSSFYFPYATNKQIVESSNNNELRINKSKSKN